MSVEYLKEHDVGFIVSYGYKHVIPDELLRQFDGVAVNLHISLLPWNRGTDPNFWSFVENTPKGVTIHYIDSGLDTGDIIVQEEMFFDVNEETFRSSYDKLKLKIEELFKENWENIKCGTCPRKKQPEGGSYHRYADKDSLLPILRYGWDTKISNALEYLGELQASAEFMRKYNEEVANFA